MRRSLVALLAVVALFSLAACSGASQATPEELEVSGVVIAADGPSLADVSNITLRTDDGQEIRFRVGVLDLSDGGLPAPHLREHMAGGEPIAATYHVESGENVLDRYADAGE